MIVVVKWGGLGWWGSRGGGLGGRGAWGVLWLSGERGGGEVAGG